MKIKVIDYLHSSKEGMADTGQQYGLRGEALEKFMYALYEVKFQLEVDTKTGDCTILQVNDRAVEPKKED